MSIIVTGIEYQFGKQSKIVQGVKGNQVPGGAVYGGNGSYRVKEKPEVIIHTSDGKATNFYGAIKMQTTKQHGIFRKYVPKASKNTAWKMENSQIRKS